MTIERQDDVDFFIYYMTRKHTHSAYIYYNNLLIDKIMIYDNNIDGFREHLLKNEQKLLLKVQIKIEC
jgi:hypothetical protein